MEILMPGIPFKTKKNMQAWSNPVMTPIDFMGVIIKHEPEIPRNQAFPADNRVAQPRPFPQTEAGDVP